MEKHIFTVWESPDRKSKVIACRLDDGVEIIATGDGCVSQRVWISTEAIPHFAAWLISPFDGGGPFTRATSGLRSIANALESAEKELRETLACKIENEARKRIENALSFLRMGEKLHNTRPVARSAETVLVAVHKWLTGIAPQLRVHQVDKAIGFIEHERSELRDKSL